MKRGEDTVKLAIAIGNAIDAEAKKSGPYSTTQIAGCLARLAASAGAICNRSAPAVGVEFVYNEFCAEVIAQCQKHGIKGVHVVEIEDRSEADEGAAH